MGVFDATTIGIVGICGVERKKIVDSIEGQGGKTVTSVSNSVKFLITSAPVNMKLCAVKKAIELKKPIIKPEFITECIQQNKLLGWEGYRHEIEEKKRKSEEQNKCLPLKKKKSDLNCESPTTPQKTTYDYSSDDTTQEFVNNPTIEKMVAGLNIPLKDKPDIYNFCNSYLIHWNINEFTWFVPKEDNNELVEKIKVQIENEINQPSQQQGFQLTTPFYYLHKHKYVFNDNSVEMTKQIVIAPILMYNYNSNLVLGTDKRIKFAELTDLKQKENFEKSNYLQADLTFRYKINGEQPYIYIGKHKSKPCSTAMDHEDLKKLLMVMRSCLKNRAHKTHKEDIEKLVIYGGLVANCTFYLFEMVPILVEKKSLLYRVSHVSYDLLEPKDCATLFINLQQTFNKIFQTKIRAAKQQSTLLNIEKAKKQTYSTFKRIVNFKNFSFAAYQAIVALDKAEKINSLINELLEKHNIIDIFIFIKKLSVIETTLFFTERLSHYYRILVMIIEEESFSSYLLHNKIHKNENNKDCAIFIAYKVENDLVEIQQATIKTEYAQKLLKDVIYFTFDNELQPKYENASLNISEKSEKIQQQRNESFTNSVFLFNDLNLDSTFGKFGLSDVWNISEITKNHCTSIYLNGHSILKNECGKVFMKMTKFEENLLPSDLVLKHIMNNSQSKYICKIFRSDFICHESELMKLLKSKGYFLDFDNKFKGSEGIYYTICEKLEDKSVYFELLTTQKSLKVQFMLLLTFFKACLKGLQYLHKELNIVHGDLSIENILFRPVLSNSDKSGNVKNYDPVIIDFDFSEFINSKPANNFRPGTFPYQHVLEVEDLRQRDLYSLGIIFAEYIRFLMEGEEKFLFFDFEPNAFQFLFAASEYKNSIINFFKEKINCLKGFEHTFMLKTCKLISALINLQVKDADEGLEMVKKIIKECNEWNNNNY
ncbi:hypothetical protein ABK040_011870 [Willaertia magna]